MTNLTEYIRRELKDSGADLVGFGDMSEIPAEQRYNLPVGISVAVKYPKEVIRGIYEMPTREYYDQYNRLNEKLDRLVILGAEALKAKGYEAVAQTLSTVWQSETDYSTMLPHKTVATRAGLGWIGKSALLVTREYGSMIRLSSILTNAPLKTARTINTSHCGSCMICTSVCPAEAIRGKNWAIGISRDEIFNASRCREVARARSLKSFGREITICGRCIAMCPFTQKYLNSDET